NLVDNFEYAPDARVSSQVDRNGITTTYTYDPNAQYRLSRILTCGSQCATSGTQTTTYTSSGTFTAPAGVTSVTVDMWGGGGGGCSGDGCETGASGGAYVHATASVTPGNGYSVTIGQGGGGGSTSAGGTGGTGFHKGGNGVAQAHGGGGGGGGSSAFTN